MNKAGYMGQHCAPGVIICQTFPKLHQTYPQLYQTYPQLYQAYLELYQTYPEFYQTYPEFYQTYPQTCLQLIIMMNEMTSIINDKRNEFSIDIKHFQ